MDKRQKTLIMLSKSQTQQVLMIPLSWSSQVTTNLWWGGEGEVEVWIKTLVVEGVKWKKKIQGNLLRQWKYSISLWAMGYTSLLSSCQNYNLGFESIPLKTSLI